MMPISNDPWFTNGLLVTNRGYKGLLRRKPQSQTQELLLI